VRGPLWGTTHAAIPSWPSLAPRRCGRVAATTSGSAGLVPDRVVSRSSSVAASVRFRSSSSGQSAPTAWLLWWPSRSAVDDTRWTHAIKSRARGRLLLRRLEPEAAGASRGRFVAVPSRPLRKPRARSGRCSLHHESTSAARLQLGRPAASSGDRRTLARPRKEHAGGRPRWPPLLRAETALSRHLSSSSIPGVTRAPARTLLGHESSTSSASSALR
jgi:hypothetical protein